MGDLLGALAGFLFVFIGIAIALYVVVAVFLNKFNKLVYGKGSAMAWFPVFDIYLLGKLTVNKLVGWVLVICIFLTSTYSTTVNGVKSSFSILPVGIRGVVSTIYNIVVLGLLIYAVVKYFKLKKEKISGVSQQSNITPTQNVGPVVEEQQPVQAPTQNVSSVVEEQQPVQVPIQNVSSVVEEQQPVQVPIQNVGSVVEEQQPVQVPTQNVSSVIEEQQSIQTPIQNVNSVVEEQQIAQKPEQNLNVENINNNFNNNI